MKTLLFLAMTSIALAQAPLDRRLVFEYPGVITPSTAVHAFSSTNIAAPLSSWTYLGSVTNLQAVSNSVPIQLRWRQEFFVVGSSNEYSIGGISNLLFSEVLTSVPPAVARNQAIR